MNDLLIRSLLAVLIILVSFGAFQLYQRFTKRRVPALLADLGPVRPGLHTLVYFTTPTCAPCKTVQRPAIEKLKKNFGDSMQVIEIDASASPEIASRWGVLSVPTTFVIDPQGEVRHINHGVMRAEELMLQVNDGSHI